MSSKTSGSVPAPLRVALPSSTPAISTPSESSTRAPSPVSHLSVSTKHGEPEELKIVEVKGLEEGHYWDGHQDDEIPDKTHGRIFRNLRYQIFTLYRRLFSIVIITNMIIFIVSMANGGLVAGQIGQLVHGNLLVAIVMRQDHVINAFFLIFCAVPLSWPLFFRRVAAQVFHIGGLHSGGAISSTAWFIYLTVQLTIDFCNDHISVATLTLTYIIIVCLLTIIVFALPGVRVIMHDSFERTHRFAGWFVTALVWAHTVLFLNDLKPAGTSLTHAMVNSPSFWMVMALTISIIISWLTLRKIPVKSEVLSDHAVRIHFDYAHPVPGSFARFSSDPLFEWHSFATISIPEEKGFSVIVSRAGDWTSKVIANPPTSLWVRGVPTCGALRVVPLFRRIILVCTGSGIGPIAPHLFRPGRAPMILLWVSRDVRKTFGDKFVDAVLRASPDAIIYDTRKHGKPNMVKLAYRMYKDFDAEAVAVLSNQRLTEKVVYGLLSRGVPAFGPIFDS